jgi:acyl-CoA thioesterase-1
MIGPGMTSTRMMPIFATMTASISRLRHLFLAIAFLLSGTAAQAADKLVVAFGDSLMAGYQLAPGDGFVPQMQAALRRSGVAAQVHNAGVSGDTSAQGRARLGWVLGSLRVKPDLVILELGANDMLRGLDPAQTRANIDAMLAELKKRQIRVLLAGMMAPPNLGAVYGGRFNAIYPDLARKYSVRLYPFFMAGVADHSALQIADAMHPNRDGVGVIVRSILPVVRSSLK